MHALCQDFNKRVTWVEVGLLSSRWWHLCFVALCWRGNWIILSFQMCWQKCSSTMRRWYHGLLLLLPQWFHVTFAQFRSKNRGYIFFLFFCVWNATSDWILNASRLLTCSILVRTPVVILSTLYKPEQATCFSQAALALSLQKLNLCAYCKYWHAQNIPASYIWNQITNKSPFLMPCFMGSLTCLII